MVQRLQVPAARYVPDDKLTGKPHQRTKGSPASEVSVVSVARGNESAWRLHQRLAVSQRLLLALSERLLAKTRD